MCSQAGQRTWALEGLKTAADYLMACHVADHQFVGQIGDPGEGCWPGWHPPCRTAALQQPASNFRPLPPLAGVDHGYWGRPEDQTGTRTAYIWNYNTPASDLLGATAAALAASSMAFQSSNATYAAQLLTHARQLYAWGAAVPGKYSDTYSAATSVYASSRYGDKLMFAAAWLARATGEAQFIDAAYAHWLAGDRDIFVGWDSTTAPAANLLLSVPGVSTQRAAEFRAFMANNYLPAWQQATGGVSRTPKGMSYPSWSQWGNLRFSANAAFMQLLYHRHTACPACIIFAKSQADYMLGST